MPVYQNARTAAAQILLSGVAWCAVPIAAGAQNEAAPSVGEHIEVSLVTVGPGRALNTRAGHSAILIENVGNGSSRLYSYGTFAKGFATVRAVIAGRPVAHEVVYDGTQEIAKLRSQGRAVRTQRLKLSAAQRAELRELTAAEWRIARSGYPYHYLQDNCSTRPRDLIDRVTGGALRRAGVESSEQTIRTHFHENAEASTAYHVLGDVLLNSEVDRIVSTWDAAALPAELSALVDRAVVTHDDGSAGPLTAPQSPGDSVAIVSPNRPAIPLCIAAGLVLGAVPVLTMLAAGKRASAASLLFGLQSAVAGSILGGIGAVLTVAWLVAGYSFAAGNENLMFANPIALLAVPLGLTHAAGSARAGTPLRVLWALLAGISLFGLTLKILPAFSQDNWRILALVIPMLAGFAVSSRIARLRGAHTRSQVQ
jgi:hypothetical protein